MRADSLGIAAAMTALNLNLGQWMPNPRYEPTWWGPNFLMLVRDWMWQPVEKSRFCYVSDGGFTDNLGIMSLLRRRCRLIIAIDATCDSKGTFSDLNSVIRMARIRFGIHILQTTAKDAASEVLNTSCLDADETGRCRRHFALARIKYPEAKELPDSERDAWLVYFKPSFTGDEGADLLKYKLENAEFPHDDTTNQFYDETRVEAYRALGFHMVEAFCKQMEKHTDDDLFAGMNGLDAALVAESTKEANEARLKRELPAAVPNALSLGETIAKSLRDDIAIAKNGELRQAKSADALLEVLQKMQQDLQASALAARAAGQRTKQQNASTKHRTGDRCEATGVYEPSCGHFGGLLIAQGDPFPPCPKGNHNVTWTPVRPA
jgi:hypothetical protein